MRFMNKYKLIGHRDKSGFSNNNSVNSGVADYDSSQAALVVVQKSRAALVQFVTVPNNF